MADDKNQMTTPKGEVVGFAAISQAATNFHADGMYEAALAFDPEVVQDMIKTLEALRDEEFDRIAKEQPKIKKLLKKNPVYTDELDDDGEETGRVILKVRQKAMIRPKGKEPFEKKIRIFDAKGKPVLKKLKIGPGSIGKASFEPAAYMGNKDKDVGVTLRFSAFQLVKYVEFTSTGPSAGAYGFEAEDDEDGFDSSEFDGDDDGDAEGDGSSKTDDTDF